MVIDRTGGIMIGLDEFTSGTTEPNVKNHVDCFDGYFGYDGSDSYEGTIFRFPLRSGAYVTSLPNNTYDSQKVLESLFEPFIQEVENCLLFMKNVCDIRVSVKDTSGKICLLYSASVSDYRENLEIHRQEMSEFIQFDKKYLKSSKIFISIFPICLVSHDSSETNLWLVINILGLTDSPLRAIYDKLSDSYLPWVAIALPLPQSTNSLSCLEYETCWSHEFSKISEIIDFIDSSLPTIHLSNQLIDFTGSVFCFLPIPASSQLPFHVQGYFALSTNRRSIKWPRYDDMSDEAKWNKQLVQSSSTICCASLVHFSVSKFQCEGDTSFIYSLWACLPPFILDERDQLQYVLHNGTMTLLQDNPLVYRTSDMNWCKLESVYFLPSPFKNTSIPHEHVCNELLNTLYQPVVQVPHCVAVVLDHYKFLKNKIDIVSPQLIRQFLKVKDEDKRERMVNFLLDKDIVISLLEVILSDLDPSLTNISSILGGIPLIPLCDTERPQEFGSSPVYICKEPVKIIRLFPGLEHCFIEPKLPPKLYTFLLKLSRTRKVNITDISDIQRSPNTFYSFLSSSMKSQFDIQSIVRWTPGALNQPNREWIKHVWEFINEEEELINILKQHELPILPKHNVSSAREIHLLPLSTKSLPYLKPSTDKNYSKIEAILAESGCQLCYKNPFISSYNTFLKPALPKGLFPILRITNIQQNFMRKLDTADNSVRLSLINIVLKSELTHENDLNLAKSFPIYASFSNTWITINKFAQYILPHHSIPQDISLYPKNLLNRIDRDNINLCAKFNIHPLSLEDTIIQQILPLIMGSGKGVPSQRNILTIWLLNHLNRDMNRITFNTLASAKWLCDSSTPPNRIQPKLYSPAEFYDPQDKHICRLLRSEMIGIFPNVMYEKCYDTLKSLGMISCRNMSLQNVLNLVKMTLPDAPIKYNLDWLLSLSYIINIHFDKIKNDRVFCNTIRQSRIILPSTNQQCVSYPTSLPFLTLSNTLRKPQEVTLCSERDSCLIAGVTHVLVEESCKADKYKEIYRFMGIQCIISPELVCKQLQLIITAVKNKIRGDVTLINNIYTYFGQQLTSNPDILQNIPFPHNCIFIQDVGFMSAERCVLSCDGRVFPYIISLDKYYRISDRNIFAFFNFLKVDSYLSIVKCQSILNQLQTVTLSIEQVNLALSVIQYSHALVIQGSQKATEYYILTQDSEISLAKQCLFNDLAWLDRSRIQASKHVLVHANISNQIASDFGCLPASTALAPTAQCISYSSAVGCGQSEDIIDRLKGILKGYRMHMDVFNELIQNSDDAGAHTVKILFDYTKHPSSSVLDEAVEDIHGPALYFFNDSNFTQRDFESILKLSFGNKLSRTNTIGRFGIGFNAVYNFTDCPSFVSDKYIQIFDPLKKYLGPFRQTSGVKFCFVDGSDKETYQDQFRVYDGLFDCNIFKNVPYKYTLFRLPFRQSTSKLSNQVFLDHDIVALQDLLQKEISQTLIFLQNVTSIEVYTRSSSAVGIKQLIKVTKNECNTTNFIQKNQQYFTKYLQLTVRPEIISSSDTVSIKIESQTEKSKQDFLVSYASGVESCFKVLLDFKTSSSYISFLPICGIAIPLLSSELSCYIYTFLPLPIRSPLPFNINGYFSLSDSRKNLSDAMTYKGRYLDLPTEWNLALINDALPNALICALVRLTKSSSSHSNNYLTSLWSTAASTEFLWKSFPEHLANRIMNSSACIFSCVQTPTVWLSFTDISFLLLESHLTLNLSFIKCIYTLSLEKGIKFANVPYSFFSTQIYTFFSHQKTYNLERIVEVVISPSLHKLSLDQVLTIMTTLLPLCIHEDKQWLFSWIYQTKCIPCGSGSDNYELNLPRRIVLPNTKVSQFYYASEMRHPVPELHKTFAVNNDNTSIALQRLGVISHSLPESEIIERCKITNRLSIKDAIEHSNFLIEYLSTEDKNKMNSVYNSIKSIPFIPTHEDEITQVLSNQIPPFAAPNQCYSYFDHHLVTPICMSASYEVRETSKVLNLLSKPSLEVVFQVLDTLIKQVNKSQNFVIDDKITSLYQYMSSFDSTFPELRIKPWVWNRETHKFYATEKVIISPVLMSISNNTYLISFPKRDLLKNENFTNFLLKVGMKRGIGDEAIISCFKIIHNDFSSRPIDPNLINLLKILIDSIKDHAVCSRVIFLPSQVNILHHPPELFINSSPHLQTYLSEEQLSRCLHCDININSAYKLGVRPSEELFCTNNDSEFGLEEDITDRIKGLIREMPIDSVFKELIQNADDAKATEMVFILDNQDYSSRNKFLVSNLPNWKSLHSHRSLNVYNNKGFSDEDIEGIQNLSVGGKTSYRNTIGRFGLGFNSVYHITDAPTFLTACSGKQEFDFCCFDPFLKYTSSPYRRQNKRGLRRGIPFQNSDKFVDQLFPLRYDYLKNNDVINTSLANIWNGKEFTMFRFPLDISESQVDKSKFKEDTPYQKEKTRIHCSFENVQEELMKVIKEHPDILLFLNNLCKLTVLRIDADRRVSLLSSLCIKPYDPSLIVIPDWFPLRDLTHVQVQRKDNKVLNSEEQKWLIYSIPEIPIEEYVGKCPSLKQYSEYYYNEKLSGYGAVAVRICHPERRQHLSRLFTYLPVGLKTAFPIHINAPLILDSSRQNVHFRKSEWEDIWHSSIIQLIIVPLYTKLLFDLRDPKKAISQSVPEKVYFNWFYSLFPNSISDKQFLSVVVSTFFDFICKLNAPFLLADNLDESVPRIWYRLKGNDCGIFKPSSFFKLPSLKIDESTRSRIVAIHNAREANIKYSLFLIKFPLTYAPCSLLKLFNGTELAPRFLLSYIQSNKRCVFKEDTSHEINSLQSMVITFHHLQTILEYILTEDTSYLSSCTIPLRIDLNNNLTYFDTKYPSYLPTFSPLLPHRGEDFISLQYDWKVVNILLQIQFVKELDCEYLAQHLKVDNVNQRLQFWEYILYIKLSHSELSKFNKHNLVPVKYHQASYYPINCLKYIVTLSLQRADNILFSALVALECPQLNFELFKILTLTSMDHDSFLTQLQIFLDTVAISDIRPRDTILGSIERSTRSSAELLPQQAEKLLHIFNGLKLSTLSRDQLLKLSSLRIFESTSSVYFSLEQLSICFVNTHDIPLCDDLVGILDRKHKLIIFKSTNNCFLKDLCQIMNKQFISVSDLFSNYIFKYLSSLPLQEKKILVYFIAGKFAENKCEFIPKLIEHLKETNFILSDHKEYHRIYTFYSRELQFIQTFLPNYSLPECWSEENLRPLFVKLGLRTSVCLNEILLVANEFSRGSLKYETMPILLKEFARILKTINFEEVPQTDLDILCQFRKLRFLPVWKCTDINHPNKLSNKIGTFYEAQLNENQNCCCTSSWIHTHPFHFPVASYNVLRINVKPDPQLVIQHLSTISNQMLRLLNHQTNVPDNFQEYFTSSYAYFEAILPATNLSLDSFQNVKCIFWEKELFLPVNMLFTTKEELYPFIQQLPPELSSKFRNFFECIGVRETADYTHYSYVLTRIHQSVKKGGIKTLGDYEEQCIVVFRLLIHELRSSNPTKLDLKSFLVLTNRSNLLPCSQVVYSDNPSILSRVKKVNIDINILRPLEPDKNRSCAPPACLQMARLSDVILEKVDPKVFSDYILDQTHLASYSENQIKEPFFYRILRRLYYHLTKSDLNELRFNKHTQSFSSENKGDSIQNLLRNLKVVSVSQIDLIIQGPNQGYSLENACDCYVCVNDSKILMSAQAGDLIFKDLAFALNTYLGGIFTEISCLDICFMLRDFNEIMDKLDEYNIDRDIWDVEAEATPNNTHPRSGISGMSPSLGFHPTRPRPEGVSIGEPDPSAAKLSLNTSQCHLLAAQHLITYVHPINRIYPSQACFLSFEALINLFQAIMHFGGSKNRLTTERNIRVYLNFMYQLFPKKTEFCKKIDMLTCPIIDYDIDTRYPSPTLIPCLGCNIPHQLYTQDQAMEAIQYVKQIMELVTNELPQMKDMLLSENDEMFNDNTTLSGSQLIDVLSFSSMLHNYIINI